MDFLEFLVQFRTPPLTLLFSIFTFCGEETFALAIICFLYWCYNKRLARIICLGFFSSGLIVQALKLTFCIPRPWVLRPTFQPMSNFIDSATGYSFPSGHTQNSSALFGSLAFLSKKMWQRIIFSCMIIGVAFSRMYFGYHTPKDVIASVLISLMLVFLINKVLPIHTYKISHVAIFLGVFSAFVLIYIMILKNLPNADLTQFDDCFKAAGAGIGFALGWYIEPTYINFDERKGSHLFQLVKLLFGLLLAILLKFGLKIILGTSLTAGAVRYFVLVCFIMILYPIIIEKFFLKNLDFQPNKKQ